MQVFSGIRDGQQDSLPQNASPRAHPSRGAGPRGRPAGEHSGLSEQQVQDSPLVCGQALRAPAIRGLNPIRHEVFPGMGLTNFPL